MASTSEPAANSAQALARSLKAPLNAVSLDAKLDVAVWLVAADERSCIFPDRLRFVLDWLCGVLRGAKAGSDGVPPRADVRFWRLLDALLHRAAGLPEPIDDAAPPAQLPRPLPSGFRTRLAQSSRLLLQSAAAALEYAAAGSMAPNASAHLCARVRRVSCLLLIEEASWFRPGAEAVAEYAGRVSQSAALLLEGSASPYATVWESMASGAPHALRAAADASSAVAALTGETPPRKVLFILTGSLLRPMLALLSSCSRLVGSGADEEAEEGGGATLPNSFRARDGASRALVCAAADAAAVTSEMISESLRSILVHVDHLPEYAATLRHSMPTPETAPETASSLGGSERCPGRTGASGRDTSGARDSARDSATSGAPIHSSGKRAPKRARAEALSGGGGSGNYTAATLDALTRFTRDDLQGAPARALAAVASAAAAATGAVPGATPSAVPSASSSAVPGARLANGGGGGGVLAACASPPPAALLLPVLPALLEWIASAYEQQQAVVREERSTRLRLGLPVSGSRTTRAVTGDGSARDGADAPAEAPTTADGSSLELGFGLLAYLATPLLGSLRATVGDTLAALRNDETGFGGGRCMQPKVEARAPLELAATVRVPAEACDALAALLRTAARCGVYRPREDVSGEQKRWIQAMMQPAVILASALATRNHPFAGTPAEASAAAVAAMESASTSTSTSTTAAAAAAAASFHSATRATHAAVCSVLDAALELDALLFRSHQPVAIALLATAPSLSRSALGLLHTLLGTAAAERQVRLIASECV